MKEKLKKIKNYIKENKFYVAIMFIGTILMIIQMKQVVLYADDLFLGIISKQGGLKGAIEHLMQNYMNWGGGPTPFIAIIFLMFRIGVWKIVAIAMIVITIILAVRMITYNNNINKGIIALCLWNMIYILNIYISSETLYWLDGNLAYVLTAFQMFIYFYYLYSRMIMKTKERKYDYFLLLIFAFFAGWSGPQAGAITVIIPILLFIWVKFINKQKINKIYWISLIIAIIGFLIYYLAPGNSGRAQEFPEYVSYNIIEKILYRADSIWNLMFNFNIYRFASISFYLYIALGFLSVIAIKKAKDEKNKKISKTINIISKSIIIFLVLNLIINLDFIELNERIKQYLFTFNPLLENLNNAKTFIKELIPYFATGIILILGIILSIYVSFKEKNPILGLTFTCAILGQIMMMLAPYSPLRTTFVTVYLLWIAIAYLISCIMKDDLKITEIFALVLSIVYNVWAGIIVLFMGYIFREISEDEDNKTELNAIMIIITIISGFIFLNTSYNYMQNKAVYNENLTRIEQFKNNSHNNNVLILKRPIDSKYGFTELVGTPWVEEAVKQYFELDQNTILEYE